MDKPIFFNWFYGEWKNHLGQEIGKPFKQKKFVDLDHVLVEKVGMSIPTYFQIYGEQKFRELESQTLKEQIAPDTVISTGGGSPCYYDNMAWINENGLSLYLYLSPKALHGRLSQSNIESRPALKGLQGEDLLAFIDEKLTERAPFYTQAHIQIDQINASLDTICQQIENYVK